MYKFEDEILIIGYILGALEEAEEIEFSQRLARNREFCNLYKQMLAVLRPVLRSRNEMNWDKIARAEVQGLTERTLQRLKENAGIVPEMLSETATLELVSETLSETMLGELQETRTNQPKRVHSLVDEVEELRNRF